MPKNRHSQSREEKTGALVAIALKLFLEKGYLGTTMAAIGSEAGIATNVVHWYFATKDELFVAALESYQSESLRELMQAPVALRPGANAQQLLTGRIAGLVKRLADISSLIASLHQRSHDSEVVREFREKTLQRHSDYIREAVSQCQVPKAEQERVIEALGYTLEGLVTRRANKAETERTVAFLVEKLTVG